MPKPMTLKSGAEAVTHKVSDLQRKYKELVEEVQTGKDVILTRNGEQVAALVDIGRYIEAQSKAAESDELAHRVEVLEAKLDLAMAGGAPLAGARKQLGLTPEEAIARLQQKRS